MGGTSIPAPSRRARRAPKRLLALRGDAALVARLRAGDEAAFEVVYERHLPGIISFCRHMLGSREEAEDAVQQCFASAHRDLLRDTRAVNLKPWLYTIARNRCLSMLRARREERQLEAEPSTEGLADEVRRRAELRELVSDLRDLPTDQRAALVLTELGDLSHAEVAEVLGCEVANVKGLVFRARAGLTERREARDASCEEIRGELATARRGGLRRGRLRHHLKECPGCSAYLDEVRRQRKLMALVLPVVPSLGLRESVLAATGIGGGGAAGGGGLLAGGLAAAGSGSTVAKIAVVGALAGGTGIAGSAALDAGDSGERPPPPAAAAEKARGQAPATPHHGRPGSPGERSASDRGAQGRKRGASRGRKVRRRGAGTPAELAPGRGRARVQKPKPDHAAPARGPRSAAPGGAAKGRPAAPPGRAKPAQPPAPRPKSEAKSKLKKQAAPLVPPAPQEPASTE